MSFYDVIEEIWELNYNSFKVAIFKCDWVENSGGIKTDELGDSRWSIVLTPPQRDFEDQYNDDVLGDKVLNCQGMPKATLDIESRLDLDENTLTYVRADCEGTWIANE
ncbi:transposase [Cucumis melo var. makuwa]|uniref:Transposase n=1 Tax=Cucumis melo var. makuwa TaxID=1194695 RepID=A0A5A7UC55_CUCMM|nr:transposase [Cucumis melo var. makuwa]TYK04169.1 transposase [Cucumis melo var. makuwa]